MTRLDPPPLSGDEDLSTALHHAGTVESAVSQQALKRDVDESTSSTAHVS